MKTLIVIINLFIASTLFSANILAATSEVIWTDHDNYSDVRDSRGFDDQFKEETFHTLEKHFNALAAKLPENQRLKIDVTNLNLAGDTRIAGVRDIRVIKEGYPPSIEFAYKLEDAHGGVIQSDEVKLRDLKFMMNRTLRYKNTSLSYEKVMLDDWFDKTFKELTVK